MDIQEAKKVKLPDKKKIITFIVIIGIVMFIYTGLYTVDAEEAGVVQRFGKYLTTTAPGLHFKIPFGIDVLTKVKVKMVYKEEFGFRTLAAGVNTRYSTRDFSDESLMLTGDLNIADVQWIVQYKIKDPVQYLFKVQNVQESIRDLSESAMRLVVGDRSIDEAIVLSRKEIAFKTQEVLQENLDKLQSGIEIVTVIHQDVNPPKKVQPAFNEVNSAKQEEERIVNNAWKEYNQIIPKAKGKAKQIIEEAQGYAVNRINRAQGDASRFVQLYEKYRSAKQVTKDRMYIETMSEVLPKIENIYIVDKEQSGILPLLNLGKGGK